MKGIRFVSFVNPQAPTCWKLSHPKIRESGQVVVLLARDHEGGQVGRVDGQEYHREQRPDTRHEPVRKYSMFYCKSDSSSKTKICIINLILCR